jgi:hypothetical protein
MEAAALANPQGGPASDRRVAIHPAPATTAYLDHRTLLREYIQGRLNLSNLTNSNYEDGLVRGNLKAALSETQSA